MKKSLSLVLATLVFVVLGCNLGSLTEKKDEAPPPPPPDSTSTDTTDTKDTTSTDSTSTTSSSGGTVSMDNFNKLKLGMSYDEAKGVMGGDGNETSSSKIGNYESKSYQWKGEKFAQIRATFRNGKLSSRSQSGITSSDGSADISQDKFNKIQTGMSYSEIKGVVGSDGEMTRESQIGNSTLTSYVWKGPKYANIRISLKDDKMQNKYQSGLK